MSLCTLGQKKAFYKLTKPQLMSRLPFSCFTATQNTW